MKNRESAEEARRCLNNTLLYKRKIEASIYGETADAKRKLLDPLGQEEDSPNAPSAGKISPPALVGQDKNQQMTSIWDMMQQPLGMRHMIVSLQQVDGPVEANGWDV